MGGNGLGTGRLGHSVFVTARLFAFSLQGILHGRGAIGW